MWLQNKIARVYNLASWGSVNGAGSFPQIRVYNIGGDVPIVGLMAFRASLSRMALNNRFAYSLRPRVHIICRKQVKC